MALLGQQAPTWLVQMPAFRAADLETLRRRTAGATRERMLRELAEALDAADRPAAAGAGARRPALERPLHPGPDSGSGAPAGAGAPTPPRDVSATRGAPPGASLHTVQQELQLHGHGVELPLTLLTRKSLPPISAAACQVCRGVGRLARLVHQRTEGNPLFMVTLVDSWRTQGFSWSRRRVGTGSTGRGAAQTACPTACGR